MDPVALNQRNHQKNKNRKAMDHYSIIAQCKTISTGADNCKGLASSWGGEQSEHQDLQKEKAANSQDRKSVV